MVMMKATVRTLCEGFFASSQDAFCEMLGNTYNQTLKKKKDLPSLKSRRTSVREAVYTALYLPCYTWICPTHLARSGQPRILFPNQMYLPNEAPMALLQLCEDDLLAVGGDGKGKRVHGERIYDYDVYNELRNPEENQDLTRPILGGSGMYPYPRRCKTGRKCIKTDIELEEPELAFDKVYVPRDERFSDLKINLFMNAGVRSFCTYFLVCAKVRLLYRDQSFARIEQIHRLFVDNNFHLNGSKNPSRSISKFPKPGVLEGNRDVWITDKEFGRQCLAGKDLVAIQRLQDFPPSSKLDSHIYGESISSITAHDLTPSLQGVSIEEAMHRNLLYTLAIRQ
ncbi:hypothetical protein GOP47_0015862 [Adiantum capillus-veneris]|uniref:Lipoxygenase domain-containing protein n=1 Tax=Adiantum capillus-veneris TaxID=13818 RepID=A0A9D4UKI8_ADICA|nr:hypothetical protein GOP47_0015862 [Adiantum capillus-veneris]